jgi:hypothetical protein
VAYKLAQHQYHSPECTPALLLDGALLEPLVLIVGRQIMPFSDRHHGDLGGTSHNLLAEIIPANLQY